MLDEVATLDIKGYCKPLIETNAQLNTFDLLAEERHQEYR